MYTAWFCGPSWLTRSPTVARIANFTIILLLISNNIILFCPCNTKVARLGDSSFPCGGRGDQHTLNKGGGARPYFHLLSLRTTHKNFGIK